MEKKKKKKEELKKRKKESFYHSVHRLRTPTETHLPLMKERKRNKNKKIRRGGGGRGREREGAARGSGKRAEESQGARRSDFGGRRKVFRWAWRSSCVQIGRARGGCALIRMHGALRWRNSFHGTRVPDHISPQWAGICVNGTEPGSVISPPNEPSRGIESSERPEIESSSSPREKRKNCTIKIWKSGIFRSSINRVDFLIEFSFSFSFTLYPLLRRIGRIISGHPLECWWCLWSRSRFVYEPGILVVKITVCEKVQCV